jgi:DHA2 family multidrug resistance protein
MSVAYGLFFGNVVLLPLWLQQFMGYTATRRRHGDGAGRHAGDPAVAAGGQDVTKVDPRRYATFAFLVFALVLWMRSNFNTQADFAPS